MAISYRPYEPQQEMLLPASLQDWLPKGHLAYFISDTVDALDLKAFYARYAGGGARNQPFHPAMMVKVLVYGYATGVFSSRKIERQLHEDVAFRMLGAGNFPEHRTIRDFRALHLKELSDLFVQVVKLAARDGSGQAGHGGHRRHQDQGQRQPSQGDELRAHAAGRGRTEGADRRPAGACEGHRRGRGRRAGAGHPGRDRAPRGTRLEAIAEARERLEQRQREADIERGRSDDDERKPRDEDGKPKGGRYKREFGVPEAKAQDNFTDPASRIMKRAGGGFDPSYNAQTAVDDTAHIIVAAELSNNAADVGQLLPMLKAVKDNTGQAPEQMLADAGYRSEKNLQDLAGSGIAAVVALGREGKRCAEIDAEQSPHTAAMAAKLQTAEGKAAYRRRKWIAEPPNGWIKSVLGFRQFSLRGLHRVQAEFKLVCLALNLRRMGSLKAT